MDETNQTNIERKFAAAMIDLNGARIRIKLAALYTERMIEAIRAERAKAAKGAK